MFAVYDALLLVFKSGKISFPKKMIINAMNKYTEQNFRVVNSMKKKKE